MSPFATHLVLPGWGEGRDSLLVDCADAVLVVGLSPGTLAKVALALKRGVLVVVLRSPETSPALTTWLSALPLASVVGADEAVDHAIEAAGRFAAPQISAGTPDNRHLWPALS